jgi:hypothetical protein
MTIAVAFMFTSCAEDPIDPLSGKYPVPDDYALNNLLYQDIQKNASTRTVTLAVGSNGLSAVDNGTGNYLYVEFLVAPLEYFLVGAAYTIAGATEAKAGNYIEGSSYWVEVAGGAEVKKLKVKDGTLYVTKNADDYTIKGTILLEDGSMVKISYEGIILFEADPVALTYTLVTETPAMGGSMGTDPIANSRMNKITVFAEGVKLAYFEVVTTDDATSLSGSYVVTDGVNATGQVSNGYYMDLTAYGGEIMKGGSYYIQDETEMFIRAGGGNVDIVDNAGTLTLTGDNLAIQDISTGFAFGILPDPGSFSYADVTLEVSATPLTTLLSATAMDLSLYGGTGFTVTLKFGEAGVTATAGAYGVTIGGTGKYISIDLKRDAGTLVPGIYNIVANETAVTGDAIAGYEFMAGIYFGSVWGTATSDVLAETPILEGGTVEVAESSGIYTVTVNATIAGGENIKAVYTGAITIQ